MSAYGVGLSQDVTKVLESPPAVNVVLEPIAPTAVAAQGAPTSNVGAPLAGAPRRERESSLRPAPDLAPRPEQPKMEEPVPNEKADEIVGAFPEPDIVREIAEAAPAATTPPVVADDFATQSAAEPEHDADSFSDVSERPAEDAEGPLRSSAVGPAVTATARTSRPAASATATEPKIHPPSLDASEMPAEAAEEPGRPSPGRPSPVAAPSLTAIPNAPSMSRPAAQTPAAQQEILEQPDQEPQPQPQPQPAPASTVKTSAGIADSPALPSPSPPPAPPAPPPAESISLKEFHKVAAEAAIQAGHAYVEAGKQAQVTLKDLLSLREKEGPPVTLTVDQVATAAFLLLLGVQLLLLPLFMPSTFRLLYSVFWGLFVGLALSFLFYYNRKRKEEANELLATNLGLKGVQMVAAGIPAVFTVSEEEKMEWLNSLVKEMWPFVDKGVCQMIKDITAQMMPGILAGLPGFLEGKVKSVGFKHLTFGAMPMRVESIKVDKDGNDGLVMELSVKWCGDPNITLAIEIPGGQKLCPRVLDISFAAKVRVVLRPLVPRLPGFVAAMATVPKPPLIKYRLDFGRALGGSVAPLAVTPVVNYFLRGVLDRMLLWPNRIVVPILQETAQDAAEVQKLMRRVRGMVRVCVLRGKQLKGLGITETAVLELTTDTEHYESTPPRAAVSPEELKAVGGRVELLTNPELITWNHTVHLLVQEPESQTLRVEAFDMNTSKEDKKVSASSRRAVGRALVKLGRVCKAAAAAAAAEGATEPLPVRVQLGEGDWGSAGGPGKGAGTIMLQMSYFPCEEFTREQVLSTDKGIIVVRLLAIAGLTPSAAGSVTAYASFATTASKRDGKASWKTAKKYWTLAGHVSQLKARLAKLDAARQRDVREGNVGEAEAKAAEMRALQAEIDGAADKSRVTDRRVTLDYSMETQSGQSFYRVTEKIERKGKKAAAGGAGPGAEGGQQPQQQQAVDSETDGGGGADGTDDGEGAEGDRGLGGGGLVDNCVLIKVVQEGRVKRAAETLGVAEVPVSRIRNGHCLNPVSGKMEYGLLLPKWQNYNPDGSRPAAATSERESEWGFPVEGSAGVRVWAVLRWVPCLEKAACSDDELDEADEAAFVNAPPSSIKPPA
ncbi:hypothetical protein PLESTB_001555900 [Pleodorina starrii]|uniref:SMP-LTD domain-containing protein n=1 Tax=Pleodorina starrii TaxID=330485 RepID=A0A9W6F829_9CHLO|nr:hypothetical protein PLESTM_001471900 [Pleodorina starrii]GLC59937.1 hypothetical protein PLESTB_001555900 [Pleodorina starrii]GLC72835.1 hypothetical protein PLESTF_001298200 [Pleodorina starrii]